MYIQLYKKSRICEGVSDIIKRRQPVVAHARVRGGSSQSEDEVRAGQTEKQVGRYKTRD